jgi:hypothetical protein
MNLSNFLLSISILLMLLGFGSFIYHMYFGKIFFARKEPKTIDKASAFGGYIGGITGPLFALAGFLIVYATIIENRQDSNEQKFENIVFKFIDYQRQNLAAIILTSPVSCDENQGIAVWPVLKGNMSSAFNFIDSSKYTKMLDSSNKIKLYYPLFYYGMPTKAESNKSRAIPFLRDVFKNPADLDSFIQQGKRLEHCEEKSHRFGGYSNKLGPIFSQFISCISYIDRSDIIDHEKKKQYVSILIDQHSTFCLAVMHFHFTSVVESPESIRLLNKYEVFGKLDPKLLQLSE